MEHIDLLIGFFIVLYIISRLKLKRKRKNKFYNNHNNKQGLGKDFQEQEWEWKNLQERLKEQERQEQEKREEWKHIKVKLREHAFDSTIERNTYNMLRKEIAKWAKIDFHVHLNEIFKIVDREDNYFNKLWVCHVDFLIRDRRDPMKIYCAIEIDGHESHKTEESTRINDMFKDRIFIENNIPLIRLCGKMSPGFVPFKEETYPQNLKNIFNSIKMQDIGEQA